DFADLLVLNKFEKRGAEDALRDVRKQWRRNHPERPRVTDDEIPVFPTIASRFNDPGVNRLFGALCELLEARRARLAAQADAGRELPSWRVTEVGPTRFVTRDPLIPGTRAQYLAEIAEHGRRVRDDIEAAVAAARRA